MLLALAATAMALAQPALPLRPCVVQAVDARCGTLRVAENPAKPKGRTIGLNVVVLPARKRPALPDAFTYLAGGPGGAAATEMPSTALGIWSGVHERHDILLVDQRGTGSSNPIVCALPKRPLDTPAKARAYVNRCLESLEGDPRYYGTRTAMDDLEAVRVALGYRSLDVYGTSYGATAAQVYLARHPKSVRTMILDGGTFVDVPFYSRFAVNGERALDLLAKRCAADLACRDRFPHWRKQFATLVAEWNRKPVHVGKQTVSGTGLAGIVQNLLLNSGTAARIPLLVNRAAAGDYELLAHELGSGDGTIRSLMYWTIWCNEPWVGLAAHGPWHTAFDTLTTVSVAEHRRVCALIPKRAEPASEWRRPHSNVPLLAIEGEADPQDPIGNLPGLRSSFPNSRVVTAPAQGHAVGQYGCIGELVSQFVKRGTAKGLDTSCVKFIVPSPFQLRK